MSVNGRSFNLFVHTRTEGTRPRITMDGFDNFTSCLEEDWLQNSAVSNLNNGMVERFTVICSESVLQDNRLIVVNIVL